MSAPGSLARYWLARRGRAREEGRPSSGRGGPGCVRASAGGGGVFLIPRPNPVSSAVRDRRAKPPKTISHRVVSSVRFRDWKSSRPH
jgi:hypothetical protein